MRNWKGKIKMFIIHLSKFNSGIFAIIRNFLKGSISIPLSFQLVTNCHRLNLEVLEGNG